MRGQAFEVFRLLIAAVVAGAILMVLLGLLQNLVTPTTDPQTAAAQLVKKFAAYGGTGSTDYIQFRKGMAIDAKAIARQAYLDPQCVKVMVDDTFPDNAFDCGRGNPSDVCEYQSNVGTRARIKVQCDDCSGSSGGDVCDDLSGCNSMGCLITITR